MPERLRRLEVSDNVKLGWLTHRSDVTEERIDWRIRDVSE